MKLEISGLDLTLEYPPLLRRFFRGYVNVYQVIRLLSTRARTTTKEIALLTAFVCRESVHY